MRVLVTGAGGFIGSRVTRTLVDSGESVFAVDRPEASTDRLAEYLSRIRFIRADLYNAQAVCAFVNEIEPECAIHLAWYAARANTGQHRKIWTA